MEERYTGLQSLPVELLREIHFLSLSPSLPIVSKTLLHALSFPSPSFAARYLLELYTPPRASIKDTLCRSLRHGICSLETVQEMERLWDRKRGAPTAEEIRERAVNEMKDSEDDEEIKESPPEPTAPPLILTELPRRIFRPSSRGSPTTYLSPLLIYLFDKYSPPVDSHQGYALSRAVILSDLPLINFLLDHGADPNQRDALAVQIAVNKADLNLVKLLVERKEEGGKRRRLEDRVVITEVLVRRAMQNDRTPEGRAIIDYFVNEKGSVPSLNSILKMGSKRPKPAVKRRVRA